jgi:hypothetical protein
VSLQLYRSHDIQDVTQSISHSHKCVDIPRGNGGGYRIGPL